MQLGIKRSGVTAAALAAASTTALAAGARYTGPVIDVHLHAYTADAQGLPGSAVCVGMSAGLEYDPAGSWPDAFGQILANPRCAAPMRGSATDAALMDETIAAMRRFKVKGILSSDDDARFARWAARAPGLFMRGFEFAPTADAPELAAIGAAKRQGQPVVMAEVVAQYHSIMADDALMEPYWAYAEANDIPVGFHIGPGPPGQPMLTEGFRIQSPLHLETVLRKHPKLRVYVAHAGYPFAAEIKALLYTWPQVYVDTGVLQMAIPRASYQAYLRDLVEAGFGDRIMFGSDQMVWPGMVGEGIAAINDAPFLTLVQKKAILHDNAKRFLRLGTGW